MCAAASARSRRTRVTPKAGQGPRDIVEAFRRYYDRVEWDSVGLLAATCTRCKIVDVIVWPDDPTYVLGCLQFAEEHHNHGMVRP